MTGWTHDQLRAEVERRGAAALAAKELIVDYYRIGYRLTWPLPLDRRPDRVPAEIPGIPAYPWQTWIGWQQEERWAALHNSGDHDQLLDELVRLEGWSSFVADDGRAGLNTASVALWLIRGLESPTGTGDHRARLTAIADRLITESLLPRYLKERDEPPTDPIRTLQNIRLIPLFTGGRLAAMINHAGLPAIREPADAAVRLWLDSRRSGYTEGVAYDGFLIEHLLQWLAVSPNAEAEDEIRRAARDWVATTLPGTPGVQAPLGDIEPEMTHWLTVIATVATSTDDHDLAAWCRTVPLSELPSAALIPLLAGPKQVPDFEGPIGAARQLAAVALRRRVDDHSGDEVLVAVSTPRVEVGHLHADAGQIVLGWRGTWWITDPGYQQYRAGEEREFTLDHQAHNPPVINGAAQDNRRAVVELLAPDEVIVDLAGCYPIDGLAARRTVRISGATIQVRDELSGVEGEVLTHWLVPGEVSWHFVDGWARLSDGSGSVVWFGRSGAALGPDQLARHPGSRGPLTLSVPTSPGRTDWIFVLDQDAGWQAPTEKSIM